MARVRMRLRKQQRKNANCVRLSPLEGQRPRRRGKSRIARTPKVTLELGLQGASKHAPIFVVSPLTQTVPPLSICARLNHFLTGCDSFHNCNSCMLLSLRCFSTRAVVE